MFKWHLLLIGLVVFSVYSSARAADYYTKIKIGVEDFATKSDGMTKFGIDIGKRVYNNLDIELTSRTKFNHSGGHGAKIGIRFITHYKPLYAKVAVGKKYTDNNLGYYSIEGGVEYKIGDRWKTNTGIRFRNAFDTKYNQKTHTFKTGIGYRITDAMGIGVSYDMKRGDSNEDSYGLGLRFKF